MRTLPNGTGWSRIFVQTLDQHIHVGVQACVAKKEKVFGLKDSLTQTVEEERAYMAKSAKIFPLKRIIFRHEEKDFGR